MHLFNFPRALEHLKGSSCVIKRENIDAKFVRVKRFYDCQNYIEFRAESIIQIGLLVEKLL